MSSLDHPEPLSPAQGRVYQRLLEHHRRTGAMPDLADLARSLGVHYVSLRQHLEALHRKGYVSFESRGRGRSPHLALPPDATGIPVLGDIPAGPLSAAVAHAEAFLPRAGLTGELFALRVHGDSMADLVKDGDVVLFQHTEPRRSGEICAVRVDGEDVTLKYLDRLDGATYALRPHNPDFPTVKVHARDLVIDGVYRGLLRGLAAEGFLQPS